MIYLRTKIETASGPINKTVAAPDTATPQQITEALGRMYGGRFKASAEIIEVAPPGSGGVADHTLSWILG